MTNNQSVAELDVLVGSIFTANPDQDRELFEVEREWLASIQDTLRNEGIEADLLTRPGVAVWEGEIARFLDLYHLRLAAAWLETGQDIEPLRPLDVDLGDEPDPVLVAIWKGEQPTRFPHLINHRGDGGYYLPVDFSEPIWLDFGEEEEEPGTSDEVTTFGSSVALQRELADLEAMLQAANFPVRHPITECLRVLRQAADHSVASDLPIVIW